MQAGASGEGIERVASAIVLRRDPLQGLGRGGVFEPAIRISDLVSVEDVDGVTPRGDRNRIEVGQPQPRPQFGFLPWLALFRRMRALRFLVFFDMRPTGYRVTER